MQTAETLRRLQRFDAARNMLRDALTMMAAMMASRYYATALFFLGNVELDRKEYPAALETFQALEQRAVALNQAELLFGAQRGQAEAFLRLGQPQPALRAAKAALLSAKTNPDQQIKALWILAEIHARHPVLQFSPHSSTRAAPPPLHYLQKALDLAATIKGYIIPGDLLDAVAEEHATKGDWQLAYHFARQASIARDKIHSLEADNRANAMLVSHQTERAQANDAHLRELASEARRAEILRQTGEILAHLGVIGQEITAHLETAQVFEVLNCHVHQLMNVDVFAIALMDNEGLGMNTVFGVDNAQPASLLPFSLADADPEVIRYARERREIYIDRDPERGDPNWHLSTRPTCSRLYAPLCLGDKVLGVMSIQSRQRHAYGTREQLIFRSLCAYTAIALSNATAHGELNAAHRKLQETQQQLVLQEKMAGLGTLTAGVAHEINNPTNFAHVAAQNQRVDIAEFEQFVATLLEDDVEPEIVQGFAEHFAKLSANVSTMLNGTERIKGIVKDLRAFTRLDEPEKKPVRLSECLISTLNLVRTSWTEKVEFITEFSDDPEIECWPALLNQVFMNLLMNGCQAIDEKHQQNLYQLPSQQRGKLWLRLNLHQGNVVIAFQDTGVGIDSAARTRIMEPFYTTKAAGIGTGLGLSIAFDIVHKHGGDLDFTSTPGEGSCFTISLPLKSGNLSFIDHPRGSNQ
jgi:signal transduction histidine kinase